MKTRKEKQFTKAKKLPQYLATVSASVGSIVFGTILGWTAQISDDLQYGNAYDFTISEDELGWIGSSAALGALLVCIPVGYVSDYFGRKRTMLLLTVPGIAGWLVITFATSVPMLIAGRVLTGITGGVFTVTVPVYITEIASKEVRGILGSYFQIMINVGVLYDYLMGFFLPITPYNLSCMLPLLVFLATFGLQPESPAYLLMKGRVDDAKSSLAKLRGITYDVNGEIEEMEASMKQSEKGTVSVWEALKRPEIRKSFITATGLVFFFHFSGINAIIFYSSNIFLDANVQLKPEASTIIVGNVMVFAMFFGSFVIDKFGRKTLLLISDLIMALCCIMLGTFFTLKDAGLIDTKGSVAASAFPLISVCVFIVAYSFGCGPVTWIAGPETSVPEMRGKVVSLAGTVNWVLTFLVTKFFFTLKSALGIDFLFYIFGLVTLIGTFFVFFYVVETRGRSVDQIQDELRGNKKCKSFSVGLSNDGYVAAI